MGFNCGPIPAVVLLLLRTPYPLLDEQMRQGDRCLNIPHMHQTAYLGHSIPMMLHLNLAKLKHIIMGGIHAQSEMWVVLQVIQSAAIAYLKAKSDI